MSNKTAIIIGAGPAGLTAAYKLLKTTDIKPVILEASQDIGGISKTVNCDGNRIDIGGHRFFSKVDEVNEIWGEIMPMQGSPASDDKLLGREVELTAGGPDPDKEDRVMLTRNRVSRIYFKKKFFSYPVSLSFDTIKNMGFIDTMRAGFGYLWSCVHKLPETSLENFYINRFGKPLYEMFFKDYTTKLWGVSPAELSADWGAQRVKGLSLWKAVWDALCKPFRKKGAEVETSLIEQFKYPKHGPGQLWETMADYIAKNGGEIIFNAEVSGIELNDDGKTVKGVYINNRNELYTCDYCLSTMPIKDLVSALPRVPHDIYKTATTLPYRDFMTVGILAKKLKISNQTKMPSVGNIVPDCWIYIQERDVKVGRLQIFNNWSPYMLNDNKNTVWVGMEYFCTEGDEMWNMADEDFIKFAEAELEHIGVIDRNDIISARRIRVKKAYPAYFGSYKDFPAVRKYLDGIENLFCLGRNGQHRYNNMDHSMMTAIEAVNCIRTGSTDKEPVWNVNTEKVYHETKNS